VEQGQEGGGWLLAGGGLAGFWGRVEGGQGSNLGPLWSEHKKVGVCKGPSADVLAGVGPRITHTTTTIPTQPHTHNPQGNMPRCCMALGIVRCGPCLLHPPPYLTLPSHTNTHTPPSPDPLIPSSPLPPPQKNLQRNAAPAAEVREAKRRVRLERNELEAALFELFGRQPHWNFTQLQVGARGSVGVCCMEGAGGWGCVLRRRWGSVQR
jgi:hypothetical protein